MRLGHLDMVTKRLKMHYPDIQTWTDDKLDRVTEWVFETGLEEEQVPEESRSDREKTHLKEMYEKHNECIIEANRRHRI